MSDPVDLRALAGDRFRIELDPSADDTPRAERAWLWRVPGRYGWVGVHGAGTLSAYCSSPRLFRRLLAIPGARLHQRGEDEATFVLPAEHLDRAADILRARRRKRLSPEAREQATARLRAARV